MKLAHVNKKNIRTVKESLEQSKEFEASGDLDAAAKALTNAIKIDPYNEAPYNRLMIILRKQKKYKEELAVIKKAIRSLKDYHNPLTKEHSSKKVSTLSRSFMKMTGMLDKKGKPVFEPEPIGKWRKRLETVEKKLGVN